MYNMNTERTISVSGNGRVSIPPDSIIISMRVEASYKDYEKTFLLASSKIERLHKKFEVAGFNPENIKTMKFDINTKYGNEAKIQTDKPQDRKILQTYHCRQDLRIQFDFDTDRLAKAIDVITSCESDPKFSIGFTVKDVEAVKDEILKKAACDARRKAAILCEASGVKLGELLSINCSWHFENFDPVLNISFEDEPYSWNFGGLEYSSSIFGKNFKPDNFTADETVNFVWKIS